MPHLKKLEIKTQWIPRKQNYAHKISYFNRYRRSKNVSLIKRGYYFGVESYPDYYLTLKAYNFFTKISNKKRIYSHTQRLLNGYI